MTPVTSTPDRSTVLPSTALAPTVAPGGTFTDAAVAALGADLADDGAAPHEARLLSFALAARAGGACAAVVEVLTDGTAPDVVRQRAFAVAARSVTV